MAFADNLKQIPGKHPNIDGLFAVIKDRLSLQARIHPKA